MPTDTSPTLEAKMTAAPVFRASALYEMTARAMELSEFGEVRMTVDWNGIYSGAWDQSFVPVVVVREQ